MLRFRRTSSCSACRPDGHCLRRACLGVTDAKGSRMLFLPPGKGDGSFGMPRAIALAGALGGVRAWRNDTGKEMLVASICGESGCGLQVISGDGANAAFVPMRQAVTSFETVSANGGKVQHVLAIAGGRAVLIDGESILSGAPRIETLVVNPGRRSGGRKLCVQLWYRRAACGPRRAGDGRVLSRGKLNAHQVTPEEVRAVRMARGPVSFLKPAGPWTEVERVANFGSGTEGAILMRAHFTGGGQDDLLLLSRGRSFRLSHSSHVAGEERVSEPEVTVDTTGSPVVAAVATRVSADSRMGPVTMAQSAAQPQVSVPAVDKTYTSIPRSRGTEHDGDDRVFHQRSDRLHAARGDLAEQQGRKPEREKRYDQHPCGDVHRYVQQRPGDGCERRRERPL